MQMESNPPITQGLQHITTEPPAWVETAGHVIHYLMNDFGGGRRCLKLAWVINFQKLATIPLLAIFIFKYHNFSNAAWIYRAIQSSYGLVWIIKDLAFPDPSFQGPATVGAGVASFLSVLGWYWVFGWLLISGIAKPKYPLPDYAWFSLCISLCILGCAIMIASDAQKYFTLRFKRGLITNGMYRFIRHPSPRRNDDLRQLCPDGMALATVCSARVGLGRIICREHDSQGSQHVAVCRVDVLKESFVVVAAANPLSNKFDA